MLSLPKLRRRDDPVAVARAELMPAGHCSRHLEPMFGLSCVRDWTRERYAERGRPNIDPIVVFKRQLDMVFAGIRSERELIEMASLNLA